MAFFSFFSQQKARQNAVPSNTTKNVSADKQTAHGFLAMRGMVLVYKHPTFTQIFLLWTECKGKQS